MKQDDFYRNKVILAPMVRVSTLPMRLLALDYGADLVYCEELIDRKILMCQKTENEILHTTDFTLSDGTVVFRTCPAEKDRLILQIGTCDAQRALAAAKKIQDYVAGVDINMGCPKEFSIKGGMGAALLTQPDKVKQILSTLVSELKVPVTCKIRILPEIDDTIKLAKLIESTGVSAIAVHGRTREERSRDNNRDAYIKAIAQAVNIPVIANGGSKDITSLDDVDKFRQSTGSSSVMVARAAMWNCSVFRKLGPLPVLDVIRSYLKYAFQYSNNEMNTKYCVLQMLHDKMTEVPEADGCLAARSLQDFADIWAMKADYEEFLRRRRLWEEELLARRGPGSDCHGVKRRKMHDGSVVIELPVRFDKRLYSATMTPKQILNNWSRKQNCKKPVYTTTERPADRYFSSSVLFEGRIYTNPFWEKSKQLAEQSAAVVCLLAHGQDDGCLTEAAHEAQELRRKWRAIINSDDAGEVTCIGAREDGASLSSVSNGTGDSKASLSFTSSDTREDRASLSVTGSDTGEDGASFSCTCNETRDVRTSDQATSLVS